jgi:hypothetical protein
MQFFCREGGDLLKFSLGSKTSDMTNDGLDNMFEGDFADLSDLKYHIESQCVCVWGGEGVGESLRP